MFARNVSIRTAACVALAMAGLARADISPDISIVPKDPAPVYIDDMATPTSAPVATAEAAGPATTVNGLLNHIPGYHETGLSLTGYVEGSWTYSAHPPAGNFLTNQLFNTKTESIQLDAFELLLSRQFDPHKGFDVGFSFESYYGWDSAYIHSNGLTTVSNGSQASPSVGPGAGNTLTIHPKMQYDLNQANVTLSFGQVGNGLTVTGGKFLTLVGYEDVNTVSNATNTVDNKNGPATGGGLYSHSYIFQEEPFTHTGLIATYNITNPTGPTPLTVTGGMSRGWNEATEDDNNDVDLMGQVRLAVPHSYLLQLSGITGNEQPSGSTQNGWRTLLDFVGSYAFSDQVFLGVNGMFAWQAQDANPLAGPGGFGGTGIWYGAAVYAKYIQSDYLTFNARGEWFDDQNGAAPIQLSSSPFSAFTPNHFFEVTLGLAVKPFPHDKYLSGLTIRPEGRWDYSDHAAFNGGAQHDQWTGTIEAYYSF